MESSKEPFVFLSFANPHDIPKNYLNSLQDESDFIYKKFNLLDSRNICDVVRYDQTRLNDLLDSLESWIEEKDLLLFHYGGHANQQFLALSDQIVRGKSERIDISGIAPLLGKQTQLKFVFLNGCATYKQAKILLDAGVKAVIATNTKINDGMAALFSMRFYHHLFNGKNVQYAYQAALDFITSKFSYTVENGGICEYRSLYFKEDQLKEILPYRLYIHSDHKEEILKWKLPVETLGSKENQICLTKQYTCDRTEQDAKFGRFLFQNKDSKFKFVLIHGESRQSHEGLVERFRLLKLIGQKPPQDFDTISIILEPKYKLEEYKTSVLDKIFREFRIPTDSLSHKDLNIQTLIEGLIRQEKKEVIIKFRFHSSRWRKFFPSLMKWLFDNFFVHQNLPPNAPNIYLFLQVLYEEKCTWINKPFLGSLTAKVKKSMQKVSGCEMLPELKPIKTRDLKIWFEETEIAQKQKQKDLLLQQYFDVKANSFDMEEVEEVLASIIETYNLKGKKIFTA
ncbi:MAG: CHAT domain-containing protein [Bacteroidota bacterium]